MKRAAFILCVLMSATMNIAAQKFSNKGTEFWAGFGHQAEMELSAWLDTPRLALLFSAEQQAKVTVTIEGTTYKQEYIVPANSVIRSNPLPQGTRDRPASIWDVMLYTRTSNYPGGTNSEGIFKNKGVHIESDVPIVAYAHMYAPASSAATMLMPTDSWGSSYLGVTTKQTVNVNSAGDEPFDHSRFSWMYFIATKNDTRIRIIPPVPTRSGSPANTPIEITLNKGEIYQLLAGEETRGLMYDLTGTTATAIANSEGKCLPFAAFMGSSGVYVSCGSTASGSTFPAEENMLQQMFPKHAWGKRYLATPTSVPATPTSLNPNVFRIMVSDPATIVKKNGQVLTGITSGFYEYTSSTADYIEADQPVQVLQIMPSQGYCGYSGIGDPEMTYLSPIEQGIARTGFYRNDKDAIDWNFLTLTIPTAGINSLKIDGLTNNYTHSYAHPNLPGYSVVIRRWNTRSNTDPRAPAQCIVESDSVFNAITYGFGTAESYGYNAGTYLNNLNGIPEYKNAYNTADTANTYTCAGSPVQLSVLMRYQPVKLEWKMSDLAGKVIPATDVVIPNPVPVGTEVVAGVTYYKYTLPGNYVFTQAGYHTISLYSTHPSIDICSNTEEIPYQVIVKDSLKTNFSITYQNCRLQELISFDADSKYSNGTAVQRWEWQFTNGTIPGTATGQHVQYLFDKGDNKAALIAVDAAGCIADTTKLFSLSDKPASPTFSATTPLCEDTAIVFAENTTQAGIKEWYWDFGQGTPVAVTTNGNQQSHTYNNATTSVTIKHVVKYSATCISDTAYTTIPVYAAPQLSVSYAAGCLPEDGKVAFQGLATTTDAQTISNYSWNFGDAASTAGNPNTATTANTSHVYTAGSYTVTFQITTDKGCAGKQLVDARFNPRPTMSFAALPDVCLNTAAPMLVNKATVTNNIAGTGIYKGTGVNSNGSFYPALATAGTHTIWYVYQANNGCLDSISATITVKPIPDAQFSYTGSTCVNGQLTFTDASTFSNGTITQWTWNMGDGTQVSRNTAAPVTQSYTTANTYKVQLVTTGSNGCTDTATTSIQTQALPVVNFQPPAAVCMPGGKAAFVNQSSAANGTALSYTWNFGDNSVSTETSPVHTYASAGNYTVKLAASATGGCADSIQKVVNSFYQQPQAGFTVAGSPLCQGTTARFTNTSTTPTGSIIKNLWNFGEGSTSSLGNATKIYTNAGNYTITLTVSNTQGCQDSTKQNMVVYAQPVIDAGPDMAVQEGTMVQLQATANASNYQFVWTPGQLLSNPNILRPTLVVNDDYVFTLTATGDNNCTATDQMKILVQRPLVIPNVFTPNGDGINDTWIIKNLNLYANANIQIFNRYGQLILLLKSNAKSWDGTVNGTPVPAGIYYYIIQLNNGDKPVNGSVTIIR